MVISHSMSGLFNFGRQVAKPFKMKKLLMFNQLQVYNVVADVQQYKHFVPHCTNSVVLRTGIPQIEVELTVQFLMFKESYISVVSMFPPERIVAKSSGTKLFKHLHSTWIISTHTATSCWVEITIDYQFQSSLYEAASRQYLTSSAQNTISAFETRCSQLYKKQP